MEDIKFNSLEELYKRLLPALRSKVKEKIEQYKTDSEKMYSVLITLVERYPDILKDVNDLL